MEETTNAKEFMLVVKQYENLIFNICRIYCNDKEKVKDLYQEIILNLWKGYQTYKPECKMITWVYRIALNTAISYQRKAIKEPIFVELSVFLEESLNNIKKDDLLEQLYTVVESLNSEDRFIIFLYLDGYSHADIAGIIGISTSNVGTRIQRIKQKMKNLCESI
ncbi:MAG: sigma-70 family RNA polymerase sigma factor [Bacteroidales bacterium]|jgi:RNA polymerase sigma-70 factor (ECF subfamily)|nr:sigma-70 family RNA polymerase sigma factor [Bacteroidales bacterium]MDX9890818.1 sigma-70 family RNA polymerase sigma factor [Bacteroidales bacterium]